MKTSSRPTIELSLKGSNNKDIVLKTYRKLLSWHVYDYEIKFTSSDSFGFLETLVITIIGSVSSHFIIKLIEYILSSQKKSRDSLKIEIHHVDNNIHFYLPEQKPECIDHFKTLDRENEE